MEKPRKGCYHLCLDAYEDGSGFDVHSPHANGNVVFPAPLGGREAIRQLRSMAKWFNRIADWSESKGALRNVTEDADE